jgi:acetyltransferase
VGVKKNDKSIWRRDKMIMTCKYPKKYERNWKLPNNTSICFRPIKTEDEDLWLEMFSSFSEESVRNRFFRLIKNPSHQVSHRFCHIDYDSELAIVAEMTENYHKRLVGVIRLIVQKDMNNGEVSFIVVDQWQGFGIGEKLLDYMLEICRERNLKTVYALTLPDNFITINLLKKKGFILKHHNDYVTTAILNLVTQKSKSNALQASNKVNRIRENSQTEILPSLTKSK